MEKSSLLGKVGARESSLSCPSLPPHSRDIDLERGLIHGHRDSSRGVRFSPSRHTILAASAASHALVATVRDAVVCATFSYSLLLATVLYFEGERVGQTVRQS